MAVPGQARGSLRDLAYETVKRRIIEAELRPGQRLIERDLADELGVSRIPLREALRLLAAEGLVVLVPRRGVLVSPFTPADIRDLFDVRESLEVLAARLAATRANADGLRRLRRSLDAALRATGEGDELEIAARNVAFHAEIVALSGNALLESMMRPLDARLLWLFRLTAEHDPLRQCVEHEELYEAIAAKDPGRAAESARRHVVDGLEPALTLAESWMLPAVDIEEITRTRRRKPVRKETEDTV
jgi:DNA-binding GntR family transcriptional regulator